MREPDCEEAINSIRRANATKGSDSQSHALIAIAESILYLAKVIQYIDKSEAVTSSDELEPDWVKAVTRISRLLDQSKLVSALGPNVDTTFYDDGLRQLQIRYDLGERTRELYDAIMNYSE